MFNGFILSRKGSNWRRFSKKIFLFCEAFYLKEMNLWPQKKIHSKGYRNGKVCYFLSSLFSDHSASPRPHTHRRVPKWHAGLPTSEEHLLSSRGEQRHLGCTETHLQTLKLEHPEEGNPQRHSGKGTSWLPSMAFTCFREKKKNSHNYVIINEKIFLHYLQKIIY